MNGLMLHCGTTEVSRDDVYNVVTPEPDGTHYPVAHTLLLEELEKNLELNGFEVEEQAHGLTRDGARYFGLLRVKKSVRLDGSIETLVRKQAAACVPCMDEPAPMGEPDYGLVIGIRNTHDRSWAAALVMGAYVFVCDNLSFSGEVLVGRKHTRNIARDIPRLIPRAFGALGRERVKMEDRIVGYKGAEISDKDAHDLIVRSIVDEGVFPASNLSAIVSEWRRPRHEEFEPRTVWSLSNAYTEVAKPAEGKPGNLQTLTKRTQNLYGFFDKELGLSLETQLTEGIEDAVTANDAL